MPKEALLSQTFVELADSLVADFDVVELLTLLADRCVDVQNRFRPAEHRRVVSRAATGTSSARIQGNLVAAAV